MARIIGRAFLHFLLPANLAGLEIDTVDRPLVDVSRRFALTAKIETLFRRLAGDRADHRSQENVIAPDGRRTPTHPGNLSLPRYVLGSAPLVRKAWIFG